MKVLWAAGALSGREVHEKLRVQTGWAYSTTRTTVERMVKKGLVEKRTFHGLHLYEPAISRVQGVARLVHEFASRVLGLSEVPVAALFRESAALEPAEIEELRVLLARTPPQRKAGG
jgi:BlaI family transcriptional regulator, penicillinase repressor